MFYTYKITNRANGKIYIGKSTCGNEISYLGSGLLIKRAIAKYGKDSFVKEILGLYELEEDALLAEQDAIAQFKARDPAIGYNIAPGGEGWTAESAQQTALAFHGSLTEDEKRAYDEKRNAALRRPECRKKISEKGKARFSRMSDQEKRVFSEHVSNGWSQEARDAARERMTGSLRLSVQDYWKASLDGVDLEKKKADYSAHMKATVNSPEYKEKKAATYKKTMEKKMASPYWKEYASLAQGPLSLKRRLRAGLISKEEFDAALPKAERAFKEIKTKLEDWLHANDAGSV